MMTGRDSKILEIMAKHQRIEVPILAEMLNVSLVTIRKDLEHLERRGLVHREHGHASFAGMGDIGRDMAYNYDIKRRIARAAAATIKEGETVMIEAGSCCAFLAEELSLAQKDITIITNSVFITNYIRYAPRTKIILLGGYYQPESQVTVGPMTKKCGEISFPDKFFVGTDGFIPDFGFTGKDHLRVQTVMDLTEYTRKIIILTDAEIFQHRGVLGMIRLEMVTDVYTDDRIPGFAEEALLNNNIALHKVPEKVLDQV